MEAGETPAASAAKVLINFAPRAEDAQAGAARLTLPVRMTNAPPGDRTMENRTSSFCTISKYFIGHMLRWAHQGAFSFDWMHRAFFIATMAGNIVP